MHVFKLIIKMMMMRLMRMINAEKLIPMMINRDYNDYIFIFHVFLLLYYLYFCYFYNVINNNNNKSKTKKLLLLLNMMMTNDYV